MGGSKRELGYMVLESPPYFTLNVGKSAGNMTMEPGMPSSAPPLDVGEQDHPMGDFQFDGTESSEEPYFPPCWNPISVDPITSSALEEHGITNDDYFDPSEVINTTIHPIFDLDNWMPGKNLELIWEKIQPAFELATRFITEDGGLFDWWVKFVHVEHQAVKLSSSPESKSAYVLSDVGSTKERIASTN